MKKTFFSFGTVLCLFILILAGCQKEKRTVETNPDTADETIARIIENPNTEFTVQNSSNINNRASAGRKIKFTYLAVALVRTGLIKELASIEGTYTLFAPTDDAFRDAGFKTIQDVIKAPKEVLTPILLYHVLGTKVLSTQVPAGPNAPVKTLNGADIYATSNSKGVFINGTPVILPNVKAINGVIHVIDKVLMPPVGNIVQTAVANPDFSLLVAAVLRASQGSTNVAALLSGNGPFTVFAPTNDAFKKLGFNTPADFLTANPDVLTPILAYHVISGRIFSSDLSNGITPAMFAGGSTTITLTGGPKIKGNGNSSPSNIVATDVVATNGVIHVIDQVLLP